ncbi:MAG: SRPBCC family protein [Candidatus Promineifilaceae bacterium]
MSTYTVSETAVIQAPADMVYQIIADYNSSHPAILPPRYFTGLTVLKGGQGAGTELLAEMNIFGASFQYHLVVSEPEPGHILKEEDPQAGMETWFHVEPIDNVRRCCVTITTKARTGGGVRGFLEKVFNPPITRKIYREQLNRLADVAANYVVNERLPERDKNEKDGNGQ